MSTFEVHGQTFLTVDPEAIQRAHLRGDARHQPLPAPGPLRAAPEDLDDPDASGNDRFIALDLLKNVNISAGGVLPMCQDTGTAIVMGKKSEGDITGADDAEAVSRRVVRC